jgi:phthalate 4,5-cis-dihydrodiol dehydrogenase
MEPMTDRKLRLGIAGLGRAFTVMLPTLSRDPRLVLVAATDPRPDACRRFTADFGGRTYASIEALCADPDIEAVYVATPHEMHADHVRVAAEAGKHVLVEKPMAITIEECDRMIDVTARHRVQLIVGHSHSFNAPIRRAREVIDSGAVGRVRMINAMNYTDFLYRPRRPEELVTASGGGVVFSQAAHQIDVVRLLGGGLVRSVRAATGAWDAGRPTEGAYAAFLSFADGAFASAVYSGYAHFDSDELMNWVGEMGRRKDAAGYGAARKALRQAADPAHEAEIKSARNYGGRDFSLPANDPDLLHQHFGFVVVSCEHADLRPMADGVMVYADDAVRLEPLAKPVVPRAEVIDELYGAVVLGRRPIHTGEWARATLEVCLAILTSSRNGAEVMLSRQTS